MNTVPIVNEFSEVFLEDLLGCPLSPMVGFGIELELEVDPFLKPVTILRQHNESNLRHNYKKYLTKASSALAYLLRVYRC